MWLCPPQNFMIIPRHGVTVIVMAMIAVDEYIKGDDLPFHSPDETLIFPHQNNPLILAQCLFSLPRSIR
jgi:hypothetical protein